MGANGSDRDVRSEAESRVLAALAEYPFDLGAVHVTFTDRGGVEVAIHLAPAEQVAAMAVLLGVEVETNPNLHASGVIHFARTACFTGGVSLTWYIPTPEPQPDVEHRRRQWDALIAALATTPG